MDKSKPATARLPTYQQSLCNLACSFADVRSLTLGFKGDDKSRIRSEIEARLKKADSLETTDERWDTIYEAQRLSGYLLSGELLCSDTEIRLQECLENNVPEYEWLKKAFDGLKARLLPQEPSNSQHPNPPKVLVSDVKQEIDPLLHQLRLEILEQFQWHVRRNVIKRRTTDEAAVRIVYVWAVTFLVLIFPWALIYAGRWQDFPVFGGRFEDSTILVPWTAVASGLLGAMFSRLIHLQSNWTLLSLRQVVDARSWISVLLRGSVGACGALVVFLFLQSGIVTGPLFPDFAQIGLKKMIWDSKDSMSMKLGLILPTPALALLTIWGFLAGFSERFVPDILSASEQKLSGAATK